MSQIVISPMFCPLLSFLQEYFLHDFEYIYQNWSLP